MIMLETTPEGTLFYRIGGRPKLTSLLRHFYADVRQQTEIAPVFAAHVTDWPSHLEKIADFWTAATGGPVLYSGPMPYKHLSLGLEEQHFVAWLDLWRRHCNAHLAPAEARQLIALAESIGMRLRQIVAVKQDDPTY